MTKKDWQKLAKKSKFLSDCDPKLLRLQDDYRFYESFRKYVPREAVMNILNEQIGDRDIAIVANSFPYTGIIKNFPIKHYCLWSRNGRLTEEEIKQYVNLNFPNNEWFYSERKDNHKSVPEIWHCHIFVKLK